MSGPAFLWASVALTVAVTGWLVASSWLAMRRAEDAVERRRERPE